jgi:LAS superfamily LD-carboxypeptidase LdcB
MTTEVEKQEDQDLQNTRKERRNASDGSFEERRKPAERRRAMVDRRSGFDRRRGPGHRRTEERRAAEEGEMTDEQFEFLMAVDQYKRANQRPFPSWTEVLEIVRALGYRKVAEQQALESFRKADKCEPVEIA